MLISLVILGLYGAGYFLDGDSTLTASGLFVPWLAAILAGVTAFISLIAYLWAPPKFMYPLSLIAYLLLTATTSILIVQTGATHSPFIALWMLIAVFSGVFGLYGLGVLFLATNFYLLFLLFLQQVMIGRNELIVYVLAGELPLAISYVIWHTKSASESEGERAFDALAKQLSQVANKSEIVINAIADGVVAIDGKGTIQLINPAAQNLLGWNKQDATGLDYRSVMRLTNQAGQELTVEADPLQRVLHGNQTIVDNELILTTNSGKKLMVSLVVSPVNTAQTSAGAIAVFRDITSEKAEERQKAEFISTASHEMRTPVASIEGYLGLALNPATATIDAKAQSYLQKAHESAQHLGRLFQDLLDVSKAEDGRLNNNPTPVDIVALTRNAVAEFEAKAKEKGLFLYFKPGDGSNEGGIARRISPVYYGLIDQDHLREVLGNLLENGLKYTRQGSVTVDVQGDEKEIIISFADTGIGIPPEDVPHLFQKFYRVDNSDTREIGGTGLGLYLCRRLIEASNGRIWVESELGKGSTFYVAIPRISHEKATELIEQTAAEATQHPEIVVNKPRIGQMQGGTPTDPNDPNSTIV